MTQQAQLTIAGVRFSIACECDIAESCPSPAYTDFVSVPLAAPDVEVPVTFLPRPVAGLSEVKRCFDAEDMWSLFLDGETRYVTHTGWDIAAPLWSAELPLDAASIRVHCGGLLVREEGGQTVISSPMRYPLDQLLLTYVLARREGLLLHSAGVECDGKLWLLAGRSRAGKSTASALLKGREGITLLSDDRIVVRRMGAQFIGYGTPWPGEARVAANRQAPLAGIVFLQQSKDNLIKPVSAASALERLLPVASVPWYEPELFPDVMSFCGALVEGVPTHELQFRPDADAAEMLAAFMQAPLV